MSDFIATFYVVFFTIYAVGGIVAAFYAAYLHRTLKRIEDEARDSRLRSCHFLNESTHKSDPTQPLLGVVYPKDGNL